MIVVLGKLILMFDDFINVIVKCELYEVECDGNIIEYDGMMMECVDCLIVECVVVLDKVLLLMLLL